MEKGFECYYCTKVILSKLLTVYTIEKLWLWISSSWQLYNCNHFYRRQLDNKCNLSCSALSSGRKDSLCGRLLGLCTRVRPRFFDQVGHKTMYASSGKKYFFTKSCHRQTYENYEQPPQTSQNLYFQSHFSVLKIGQIFPKKNSMKNILLGDQLLLKNVFENFDF